MNTDISANNRPLIQLSLLEKFNGRFWFAFYHDAGHILKHSRKVILWEAQVVDWTVMQWTPFAYAHYTIPVVGPLALT